MTAQNNYAPNSPAYTELRSGDLVAFIDRNTDGTRMEGTVSGTPDQFTGYIYVNLTEESGGGCIVVPPKALTRIG